MTHYAIPRRYGWEEILEPLVVKITGAQQADVRGGCHYDSELFFMQPYYLGSCPCSYGQKLKEFSKKHKHSSQCFHTIFQEIEDAFKSHPKYHQFNVLKAARVNMVKQLCVKNNITYDPTTVSKICTCRLQTEWNKLKVLHDDDCPVVLPNFWYKKNGLKIWWYKIFFRGAYANMEVTQERFKEIVADCLTYVDNHPQEENACLQTSTK